MSEEIKKNVIWIDDEADKLISYAESYVKKGITIQFIRTLTRAKRELKERASAGNLPDAILLDIMMPGYDPIELNGARFNTDGGHIAGLVFYQNWLKSFLAENKKEDKEIIVIALTNLSTPSFTVEAIKDSGLPYIQKSYKTMKADIADIVLGNKEL